MRTYMTFDPSLSAAQGASEHRLVAQRAEQERAESRRRELDSQSSDMALPEERIRIWERLHALQLPKSEEHPLVSVIAKQTHLSIGEVNNEQIRRRS